MFNVIAKKDLFEADWELSDFQNLIEYGLDIGSKYFFLLGGGHGLSFMVRDTDSEGLDSNPKKFAKDVFLVHAKGFESELGPEKLRKRIDKFYKGDICEWFRLSRSLLDEVKNQRKSGYTKLRISSKPLELKKEYMSEETACFIVHRIAIYAGGTCPVDVFNADIRFEYRNDSKHLELKKFYDGKPLFVDTEEAEIINFYLKVNNQNATKEDYFIIRNKLENKGRIVEAAKAHIYLEKYVENPHKSRYYQELAELQLYAGDINASLKSNLKALEINPYNLPILTNAANRFRDLGEFEEAKKYYKKALDLDSDDPILQYNYDKLSKIENFEVTSFDAFYKSLLFHYQIRKNGGVTHKKYDYSDATELIIFKILCVLKVENDLDMELLKFTYQSLNQADNCKNFYIALLNDSNQKGRLQKDWNIGHEGSTHKYIRSFIEEVDWEHVSFMINVAISDACDPSRIEYILSMFKALGFES